MKKTVAGLFTALIILSVFAGVVSAYRGDPSVQGPYYSEERHASMTEALDNLDYDAWVALMTENGRHPRVVDVVTEENFATFVEAHQAALDGDAATAEELRAELGLGLGDGPRQGYGQGMGRGLRAQQSEFVDADGDGVCDNLGTGFAYQGRGRR